MKRIVALLAGVVMAGTAPAAETLGRFFFTPAERAQLDLARAQKKLPQVKPEEPAESPGPQVLTYSGVVRRSDGRSVLWLNNKPVDEKQALSSLAVTGHVRDGAVTVQVPQTGRNINLKVGQSVELTSGAVAEGVAHTSPAPPRKPAADTERSPTQAPAADAAPGRKEEREAPAGRAEAQPRAVR